MYLYLMLERERERERERYLTLHVFEIVMNGFVSARNVSNSILCHIMSYILYLPNN